MPKTRKPVADYVTFQQYQDMLKRERDPLMRLAYRYMWTFLLRVSEVVGQSRGDVRQIKRYRTENKAKKERFKWGAPLPGIRPVDIDAVQLPFAKHSLRVYRKHGKFEILPFTDEKLYEDTIKLLPEIPDDRIMPYARQEVLLAMQAYGHTLGGQTLIHPHALRRGAGIHFRSNGGRIEVLQAVYSHEQLAQTLHYIGIDRTEAFKEFAEAQKVLNRA